MLDHATLVYKLMLYQVGKAIGTVVAVPDFPPNAIVLTSRMAHSAHVVDAVRQRCQALAPLHVYPGGDEGRALAEGAECVLAGIETAMTRPLAVAAGDLPW